MSNKNFNPNIFKFLLIIIIIFSGPIGWLIILIWWIFFKRFTRNFTESLKNSQLIKNKEQIKNLIKKFQQPQSTDSNNNQTTINLKNILEVFKNQNPTFLNNIEQFKNKINQAQKQKTLQPPQNAPKSIDTSNLLRAIIFIIAVVILIILIYILLF